MHLQRNLNNLETNEWGGLSHLLAPICLQNSPDSWTYPLNSSLHYSVKSLMEHLVGIANHLIKDIYSVTWDNGA